MSKLILGSLDKNRLFVFHKLTAFKGLGILGGGTGLSLQIGHRISYDFDIFVDRQIDEDVWKKAKRVFGKSSQKILDTHDQLDLLTPESVKVTFFFDDYKPLFTPIKGGVIDLLDPKDIATNKAFTLGKRPKWRDYVDLYFLLKYRHILLEDLIKLSERKYGSDFSEKLFLEQLVYWGDTRDYTIEFLKAEVLPKDIKSFLENEVKDFKRKSLGVD